MQKLEVLRYVLVTDKDSPLSINIPSRAGPVYMRDSIWGISVPEDELAPTGARTSVGAAATSK